MKRLDGKVAVVTGAATGIGAAIARELFREGASVVFAGRNGEACRQTALQTDPSGRRAISVEADVKIPEDMERMVRETIDRFGALHLAVNNAGITGPHDTMIQDVDAATWNDVIATDLGGVFFGMKYEIPAILENGGGAIVNLSSGNGIVGVPGLAPYTAAKHGIIGLTRSAALELAQKNIRVNAICPGYVDTPRMKDVPEETRQWMAGNHPMGRMAKPEEVARLASFLLSPDSSFITGSYYLIDGGLTAQ